jgi:hypothetical protein
MIPNIETHHYARILAYLARHPNELTAAAGWPRVKNSYLAKGISELCTGLLEEAAETFERGNSICKIAAPRGSITLEPLWAVAQIGLGKPQNAIDYFFKNLRGIKNGEITYVSGFGGGTEGTRLLYLSLRNEHSKGRDEARSWLSTLAKKSTFMPGVPGPFALRLLGVWDDGQVLEDLFGKKSWSATENIDQDHRAKRDFAIGSYFYCAIGHEMQDDPTRAKALLDKCSRMEPIYSFEWFMARMETQLSWAWQEI